MEDLLPSYAREIEELFSRFATAMKRKGEDITLTNILSGRKPFTEHLFSDNIEDYIYKTVSHKITGGFSTTLGYLIENLSEIILRSAGAEIVKENPRPYDLKFIHTDGKEWMTVEGFEEYIGLYHKYGRKPFLDEFKNMDDEDKMFERYCELDSRFTDETHLRSWFRDQVLHPHETTHTMEEVSEILYNNNMELMWSSVRGDERLYEDLTKAKLSNNEYWPGFFTFLARRI